ncbi:MAG: helix-turn-helix transcriptional regulator, partial [Burkholderiaceae bacterium]|nr:helix-turn-helix transcriptional regulator [Burkholderiaceae bacterium]
MFDTEAIAKRIRAARVHGRRLTQEDFAVEMGIQQSAVSDLERAKKGSGISDLNRLKRLAQTLEVELPYLVFGIGDDGLPTFTEDSTLEAIGLRRIRKTHRTLIVEAIGHENWKDSIVTAYEYLTDRLYVLKSVDEEGCPKRLALLIHEDRIVGTALARKVSIKELKDTSESETMIGRVLNPY